jgi:hypothetical protein
MIFFWQAMIQTEAGKHHDDDENTHDAIALNECKKI